MENNILKNEKEKKNRGKQIILILIVVIIIFLLSDLFLARRVWSRQVDDVHPLIPCSMEIFEKTEILMVIPLFNNVSIAENKSWCEEILEMNKTLGMHGVYHGYREFLEPRSEEYIKIGMEEFKKCFGFYPTLFEAPQLALGKENSGILNKMGFQIVGWPYTISHKVYHCQDSGEFSMRVWKDFFITNKLIDYI